jgi:outer membrane protein OmpA-like peptidoglycan-associated protein
MSASSLALTPKTRASGSADTLWGRRSTRWLVVALIFSLIVHLLLLWWFGQWRLREDYAIPATYERVLRPFQLKRVELNPASLQGMLASPSTTIPLAKTPVPSPKMATDGQAVERALQSARPQMMVPPPPDSANLVRDASADASPYLFSEQAALSAEIARFEVGPLTAAPGTPGAFDALIDPSGSGLVPGPGGLPGIRGPVTAGGAAPPSFDDVVGGFQTPQPGLNPNLPEPVLLRLPSDVLFDFDSDELRPVAVPLLLEASHLIRKYPTARVRVDGHTDTIGADEYNMDLSQRRAKSAEKWLRESLPIEQYHIESRGFGKTKPLVNPEGDADAQQANRRVEIVIWAIHP